MLKRFFQKLFVRMWIWYTGALLVLVFSAHAGGIGGSGPGAQPGNTRLTSISQVDGAMCATGTAITFNGTSNAQCGSVSPGTGDSVTVNTATAAVDMNLVDGTGDGATSYTLTGSGPSVVKTILLDQAVSPAKMKNASFGLFTCASGVCTANNAALDLTTKTSGSFVSYLNTGGGIAGAGGGCLGTGANNATCTLSLDTASLVVWTGEFDIDITTGVFKLPHDNLPTAATCFDNAIRIKENGAAGQLLWMCNPTTHAWESIGREVRNYDLVWPGVLSTDDRLFAKIARDSAPTSLDCVADGGSGLTTVDVSIQECNANGGSCVDIGAAATMTVVDTNANDSSFTDNSLAAGNWLKANVGTVTWTTPGTVTCTFKATDK